MLLSSELHHNTEAVTSPLQDISLLRTAADRVVEYLGAVDHRTNQTLFSEIKKLMRKKGSVVLTVSSAGGPTGAGMCFYDTMRHILRPDLVTVGSGDVDSSGVLIFLSGKRRMITSRTTMLLHMAGRYFDPNMRYTTAEMDAMLREDTLKDQQYAEVVAMNSRLSADDVLDMMRRNVVLAPQEIVAHGIAHAMLD